MAEWEAFFQIEPFGPPAEFWCAGAIRSTIVNVNRTKKTQKLATAEDFMPDTFTARAEPAQQDVGETVVRAFKEMEVLAKRGPTHG